MYRSSESYGRVEGGVRLAHVQAEPSFSRAAQDVLRQIRVLLVLGGVLRLAGQALVVSSFLPITRGGTVTIPAGPNWYYAFELDVLLSGRVDLQFSELGGGVVDVRVFPASEYRVFAFIGRGYALFTASDSSAPSRFSFRRGGSWYLVLDHGQGFEESIQDVRIAFRLAGVNPDLLLYGGAFTAIGAVLVLLDRRQKGRSF